MIRVSRWRCVAAMAVAVAVLGDAAQAQEAPPAPSTITHFFYADASQEGVISLFFDAAGARIEYFEQIDERLEPLGTTQTAPGEQTIFRDATTWSCERLVRQFRARATLADGTLAVGSTGLRTRSCADRFDIGVPRRVAPGKVARVRVVDRWGNGAITPTLCIAPPRERPSCDKLAFPRAVAVATHRFRASTRGRWRIELRVGRHRERAALQVGSGAAPTPPPTLLATGDSTMQGVDSFISSELGDTVRVLSHVQLGFGISKSSSWLSFARGPVGRLRPSTTVFSAGGTEGATMPTPGGAPAKCCDEAWVAEYSRRVRAMMRTYARGGRARVFWLTLPEPRSAAFVTDAVNAAILRAGQGQKGVTVLRMDTVFTPNGYTDVIRYRGRDVRVREDDGLHLNVAGTAIAARLIARAVRGT